MPDSRKLKTWNLQPANQWVFSSKFLLIHHLNILTSTFSTLGIHAMLHDKAIYQAIKSKCLRSCAERRFAWCPKHSFRINHYMHRKVIGSSWITDFLWAHTFCVFATSQNALKAEVWDIHKNQDTSTFGICHDCLKWLRGCVKERQWVSWTLREFVNTCCIDQNCQMCGVMPVSEGSWHACKAHGPNGIGAFWSSQPRYLTWQGIEQDAETAHCKLQ